MFCAEGRVIAPRRYLVSSKSLSYVLFVLFAPVSFVFFDMATSARVTISASHVQLAVFSGLPDENANEWCTAAEHALAAAALKDDSQATAALLGALSGPARARIDASPATAVTKPDHVFKLIKEQFPPAGGVPVNALTALLAFQQGSLPVNSYDAYKRRLASLFDPQMSDDVYVSHFLAGLNPTTQAHVLAHAGGKDLAYAEAIGLARSCPKPAGSVHAVLAAPATVRSTLDTDVTDTPALTTAATVPSTSALLAAMERNTAAINALVLQRPPPRPSQSQPQQSSSSSNRRPRDASRDKWAPDGTIICNHCNEAGHKAAFCPRRRRAPGRSPPHF